MYYNIALVSLTTYLCLLLTLHFRERLVKNALRSDWLPRMLVALNLDADLLYSVLLVGIVAEIVGKPIDPDKDVLQLFGRMNPVDRGVKKLKRSSMPLYGQPVPVLQKSTNAA